MTCKEYMETLADQLSFIPEQQRKAILDYYQEMVEDRMEDGMDELSAVAAMESPADIAERLKAEDSFSKEETVEKGDENLTDEAMRFSSLAGSLLRTFEDLEKAGSVTPPEPPTPPEPVSENWGDAVERMVDSSTEHSGIDAEELGDEISDAVQRMVDSTKEFKDFFQRHTTETMDGEYEKKTFTCPASTVRTIRLLTWEMPIRVSACEGNDLTLIYYTCDDDPYEMNLDDGTLTLERVNSVNRGSRFTFSMLGGIIRMGWNKSAPTVELFLPRDALVDLLAHASNASVKVSGCQALCEVDVKTNNSRIEVGDLSCMNLTCASSNGRLVVKNVRSRQQLSCRTSNSRIEANALRSGGDMHLTTSNNHIDGRNLQTFGNLTITSSNGGVVAEDCAAKGELRMASSNGRVEVWRSDASAVLLKTSNGSIRGTLPGSQQDWAIDSHTSNGRNSLPKQQPGRKTLSVRTSNGTIDLHFEQE
ncbi:MAG: DUF4097 family beta strand repeat protein [Clostridia bacterium]|nr:DUF4097 family beta strand repeat protein [Clostridia bacterium]MBR0406404.1 DUF4097 family beta strand repeat protein [Clostridia bacterium]